MRKSGEQNLTSENREKKGSESRGANTERKNRARTTEPSTRKSQGPTSRGEIILELRAQETGRGEHMVRTQGDDVDGRRGLEWKKLGMLPTTEHQQQSDRWTAAPVGCSFPNSMFTVLAFLCRAFLASIRT